jgi:hypothetical protein
VAHIDGAMVSTACVQPDRSRFCFFGSCAVANPYKWDFKSHGFRLPGTTSPSYGTARQPVVAPTLSIESTTDLASSTAPEDAPVGAIVGGIVGLLGAIAGAVFVVRWRRSTGEDLTDEGIEPLETIGGATPMMADLLMDDRLSTPAHPTLTADRDDGLASVAGFATPPSGAKLPVSAAYTGVANPGVTAGPDSGYGDIDSILPSQVASPVQGGQDGYGAMPALVNPSPVAGGQSGYGELPPPVEVGQASYGELPVHAGASEAYDGLPQAEDGTQQSDDSEYGWMPTPPAVGQSPSPNKSGSQSPTPSRPNNNDSGYGAMPAPPGPPKT